MGISPNDYNEQNMRREEEESEPEDEEEGEEPGKDGKRRRRRRKKKQFRDPSEKDIRLARAYGGVARGPPVRKKTRLNSAKSNSRRVQSSSSKLKIEDKAGERLFKIATSVSGYHRTAEVPGVRSVKTSSDAVKRRVGELRKERDEEIEGGRQTRTSNVSRTATEKA